jgi:predicted secreted protein with PEFG-CTERM motif
MKIVEVNVPEFGSVALVALAIAIIGSVVLTKKIKLNSPTITNLILLLYFFNLTLIIWFIVIGVRV